MRKKNNPQVKMVFAGKSINDTAKPRTWSARCGTACAGTWPWLRGGSGSSSQRKKRQ